MEITQVPNSWELASLVCKFLFYIGAAASLGSAVSLCLYNDGRRVTVHRLMRYQLIGGLIGFHAVLINFLVQVGLANNSGLAGAFDWFMAEILLWMIGRRIIPTSKSFVGVQTNVANPK